MTIDRMVSHKNTIIGWIDGERFYKAWAELDAVQEYWCSEGYGYKGWELCHCLLNALEPDRIYRHTQIKKFVTELRNTYHTKHHEYIDSQSA